MQADPEIVEIRREPGDTRVVGEEWHTDTTMMPAPPMGAILYAIEVPPYGGDTLSSPTSTAPGRRCRNLAVNDAGPFRRLMRRIQIAGDPPRATA